MSGQLKSIQRRLNATSDSQKYHRRREARGRSSAESLNERVQYWSAGQTVVLVVVAVAQVATLRRFFAADADRPVRQPWPGHSPNVLGPLGTGGRYARVEMPPA